MPPSSFKSGLVDGWFSAVKDRRPGSPPAAVDGWMAGAKKRKDRKDPAPPLIDGWMAGMNNRKPSVVATVVTPKVNPYSSQPAPVPLDVKLQLEKLMDQRAMQLQNAIDYERTGTQRANNTFNDTMREILRWRERAVTDAKASAGGRGLALSPETMLRAARDIDAQEMAANSSNVQQRKRVVDDLAQRVRAAQLALKAAEQESNNTRAAYRGDAARNLGGI